MLLAPYRDAVSASAAPEADCPKTGKFGSSACRRISCKSSADNMPACRSSAGDHSHNPPSAPPVQRTPCCTSYWPFQSPLYPAASPGKTPVPERVHSREEMFALDKESIWICRGMLGAVSMYPFSQAMTLIFCAKGGGAFCRNGTRRSFSPNGGAEEAEILAQAPSLAKAYNFSPDKKSLFSRGTTSKAIPRTEEPSSHRQSTFSMLRGQPHK